jgi:hypothetical protein
MTPDEEQGRALIAALTTLGETIRAATTPRHPIVRTLRGLANSGIVIAAASALLLGYGVHYYEAYRQDRIRKEDNFIKLTDTHDKANSYAFGLCMQGVQETAQYKLARINEDSKDTHFALAKEATHRKLNDWTNWVAVGCPQTAALTVKAHFHLPAIQDAATSFTENWDNKDSRIMAIGSNFRDAVSTLSTEAEVIQKYDEAKQKCVAELKESDKAMRALAKEMLNEL